MPNNRVINGEIIAFDDEGRPSFNALQNYGSAPAPVVYYVFDVMVLAGRDVMREPLETRRDLLERKVLPKLSEAVRYASSLDAALPELVQSVKAQGCAATFGFLQKQWQCPGCSVQPTHAWAMNVRRPDRALMGLPYSSRPRGVLSGSDEIGDGESNLRNEHHPIHVRPRDVVGIDRELLRLAQHQIAHIAAVQSHAR
jgi:hypothetical protein